MELIRTESPLSIRTEVHTVNAAAAAPEAIMFPQFLTD